MRRVHAQRIDVDKARYCSGIYFWEPSGPEPGLGQVCLQLAKEVHNLKTVSGECRRPEADVSIWQVDLHIEWRYPKSFLMGAKHPDGQHAAAFVILGHPECHLPWRRPDRPEFRLSNAPVSFADNDVPSNDWLISSFHRWKIKRDLLSGVRDRHVPKIRDLCCAAS